MNHNDVENAIWKWAVCCSGIITNYRAAKDIIEFVLDWASVYLSKPLIAGQSLSFTINGIAITAIPFHDNSDTTLLDAKTVIEDEVEGTSVIKITGKDAIKITTAGKAITVTLTISGVNLPIVSYIYKALTPDQQKTLVKLQASVIWANNNGVRPPLPYITINHEPMTMYGMAERQGADGTTGIEPVYYTDDIEMSIQGYGEDSADYLINFKESLMKIEVLDYLNYLGLVFRNQIDIHDIPMQIDSTIEIRHVYTVFFGYSHTISDDVGVIEHVNVEDEIN